MGMSEPWTYGSPPAQDRQYLEANIQAEIEANRRYTTQAEATANPALARMWRRFARDKAWHTRMQQAILAGYQSAAPGPWSAAPGPWSAAPGPWSTAPGPWGAAPVPYGRPAARRRGLGPFARGTLAIDAVAGLDAWADPL